jgi:hypothetical protein
MDRTLAFVLGGASCVWDDVEALGALAGAAGLLPWPGAVIAVNDVGCHWPLRLDAWATLHPEKLKQWKQQRAELGHAAIPPTWSRKQKVGADHWVRPWGGGSSGLLGAQLAMEVFKCTRIILCGIPMTKTPHFSESTVHMPLRLWASADGHFRPWRNATPRMKPYVRSMSGRTRDLLGPPTLTWLTGNDVTNDHPQRSPEAVVTAPV